jgi:hypothetical protein
MPLIEVPQIFLFFAPALQVIPLWFDSLLAIEPQLFLLCSKSFLAIEPQHLPLWFKTLLAFEPQFSRCCSSRSRVALTRDCHSYRVNLPESPVARSWAMHTLEEPAANAMIITKRPLAIGVLHSTGGLPQQLVSQGSS